MMNFYMQIKDLYGIRLTQELIDKVKKIGTDVLRPITQNTTHYGAFISPVRIINYIYKRQKDKTFIAGDLCDHWRILFEYYGRVPEELIFPSDFAAAHRKFTELATAKQNADQDAGIRRNAEKMAAYAWRDDERGMMIFPADSTFSLVNEGKVLHHCVSTYAKSVARGETMIFFIRRTDEPDEPFYTLEYKDGKVQQNRGVHNRMRTPEVQDFENAWLEHIKELAMDKQSKGRRSA